MNRIGFHNYVKQEARINSMYSFNESHCTGSSQSTGTGTIEILATLDIAIVYTKISMTGSGRPSTAAAASPRRKTKQPLSLRSVVRQPTPTSRDADDLVEKGWSAAMVEILKNRFGLGSNPINIFCYKIGSRSRGIL